MYPLRSSYVWIDQFLAAPSSDSIKYIPPQTTIHFGGGTFQTNGSNHSTGGWPAKSGWRIVGAGAPLTTLKLVGTAANEHRAAIGMNYSGPDLDGFECSDLTIDCGYPASSIPANSGNTAIAVFGSHIFISRVRVINYGTNRTNVRMGVIYAGVRGTNDSVVDSCTIEPGTTGAAPTGVPNSFVLVLFSGQAANPNRSCVVRNCVFRGPAVATSGADNPVHGICPGAALGFLAENNQLFDLYSGIYDADVQSASPVIASETTADIILRNNYMRNVFIGANYSRSWPVGRVIAHDNIMEVVTRPLLTGIKPVGLSFQWSVANANRYGTLMLRENIIRSAKWDTTPEAIIGMNITQVTDLDIENNLINNVTPAPPSPGDPNSGTGIILGTGAGAVTNKRIFNNRNSAGQLVRPDA